MNLDGSDDRETATASSYGILSNSVLFNLMPPPHTI